MYFTFLKKKKKKEKKSTTKKDGETPKTVTKTPPWKREALHLPLRNSLFVFRKRFPFSGGAC